jgi:hypothetical protein
MAANSPMKRSTWPQTSPRAPAMRRATSGLGGVGEGHVDAGEIPILVSQQAAGDGDPGVQAVRHGFDVAGLGGAVTAGNGRRSEGVFGVEGLRAAGDGAQVGCRRIGLIGDLFADR